MSQIIEKLKDSKSPPADTMRLIAIQIAGLIVKMQNCQSDIELRALNQEFRALRELSALTVSTADGHIDPVALNFDGPKFEFAIREIIVMFEEAAEEALGKGSQAQVEELMKSVRNGLEALIANIRNNMEQSDLNVGTT